MITLLADAGSTAYSTDSVFYLVPLVATIFASFISGVAFLDRYRFDTTDRANIPFAQSLTSTVADSFRTVREAGDQAEIRTHGDRLDLEAAQIVTLRWIVGCSIAVPWFRSTGLTREAAQTLYTLIDTVVFDLNRSFAAHGQSTRVAEEAERANVVLEGLPTVTESLPKRKVGRRKIKLKASAIPPSQRVDVAPSLPPVPDGRARRILRVLSTRRRHGDVAR